jgi:PAS domain-containing protein
MFDQESKIGMKRMTRLAKTLRRLLARHDAGAGKSLPFLDENTRFAALQKQLDALSESERGLRITLMSMGDGVITTDSKGSVTFLNPSRRNDRWTLEQAVGKPFSEVFRIENSMTGQPGEDIVEAVLTTRRKVSLSNHMVLISADAPPHISDSARPSIPLRQRRGVVLIFSDVTERYRLQQQLKISEARSSAAVEMALLGTWEHDERANAVVWSPAYKRIMGVPEDFAPGPDFWKTRVHRTIWPSPSSTGRARWRRASDTATSTGSSATMTARCAT